MAGIGAEAIGRSALWCFSKMDLSILLAEYVGHRGETNDLGQHNVRTKTFKILRLKKVAYNTQLLPATFKKLWISRRRGTLGKHVSSSMLSRRKYLDRWQGNPNTKSVVAKLKILSLQDFGSYGWRINGKKYSRWE
jgi:hypothetical protein